MVHFRPLNVIRDAKVKLTILVQLYYQEACCNKLDIFMITVINTWLFHKGSKNINIAKTIKFRYWECRIFINILWEIGKFNNIQGVPSDNTKLLLIFS